MPVDVLVISMITSALVVAVLTIISSLKGISKTNKLKNDFKYELSRKKRK